MPTKQLEDLVCNLEKLLQAGLIKKPGGKDMTETTEDFANVPDPEGIDEPVGIQEEPGERRKNLEISIDENEILRIRVNLRLIEGESRSGRSWVICSSGGNLRLWDGGGLRSEVLNMSLTKRKPGAKPIRWHSYA